MYAIQSESAVPQLKETSVQYLARSHELDVEWIHSCLRSEHDKTSGVLYTESETGQDVSFALRTANKSSRTTRCALWPHPP